MYVIYTLTISIAWFFLNRLSKFNYLASGFFVGLTAVLRPPFILAFIPFIIAGQYSFLLGGITGILSGLLLSFTVVDIFIWKQYILAMFGMTGFVNLNQSIQKSEAIIAKADVVYPQIAEGINTTIRNPLEYNNLSDSSIYYGLNVLDIQNRPQVLLLGFAIVFAFLILYFVKYNSKRQDNNLMFLYGILICLISEFFIPVSRYSYYDIQLIVPLFIIITQANVKQLIESKSIAILLSGLLLSVGCFNWIPKFLILSTYLITFYIVLTSLILARQEN